MNKKIMAILTERDTAIQERNIALAEKKEALAARDEALRQRDEALVQRDTALMEWDNAIAALQKRDHSANFSYGSGQHGTKRRHHSDLLADMAEAPHNTSITNVFPISSISSEAVKSSHGKQTMGVSSMTSKPQRAKKVEEDFYMEPTAEGKKHRSESEVRMLA